MEKLGQSQPQSKQCKLDIHLAIETTIKLGTAFVALLYFAGLVVTNMYLAQFGSTDFSPFSVRFVLTGLFVLFPFLLFSILVIGLRDFEGDYTYLSLAISMGISTVLPLMFFVVVTDISSSSRDYEFADVLTIFAISAGVMFSVMIGNVILDKEMRDRRFAIFNIMIIGIVLLFTTPGYLLLSSTATLPSISQQYGGLKAVPVTLSVSDANRKEVEALGLLLSDTPSREELELIWETNDSLLLRVVESDEVIRVSTELVSAWKVLGDESPPR